MTQTANRTLDQLIQDTKDANRYRWLRDNGHLKPFVAAEENDRIVDEEMAKPKQEFIF